MVIVKTEILWTLVIHPHLVRRTKKLRGTRLSMEHTEPTRRQVVFVQVPVKPGKILISVVSSAPRITD